MYYRHICEIFDESLRRKPFDSVIDYIDGYLEIELELFGLNIDDSGKHLVKLGVPKDILGFFQYNKGHFNEKLGITSIVDAIQSNIFNFQDKDFFMGRDGIYFRII